MNPLVTVLIITYNHVNTFKKAIESVLEQKTNFEFKIWILDDASNDGTSDLVRHYAGQYPEKIVPIIRSKNLGAMKNLYQALKEIDTKYFATLESDDYWCDINKLQEQVDIMERNPDCSFCGHNTLVKYERTNKSRIYIKAKKQKYKIPIKKISKKNYIEPHTSSRLYRTECLKIDEIKNPIIATYDIATNFYFLTKGNLFYIDKIMSIYNYTEKGIYSRLSSYEQRYNSAYVISILNKEFDYKYNNLLSRFFSTRLNLNFITYLNLKYLTKHKNLQKTYQNILDKYQKIYLSNFETKPIFNFVIPISSKKRISLELKREKLNE